MKTESTTTQTFSSFIKNLRAALPYLEKFYNEIFVIKISGYTLQQDNLPGILDDLILLRRVGIKIILVHGAAPQVNELIEEAGKSGGYIDGRLILDSSTFPLAYKAIASTNWELITKFSKYGSDFLPVTGHFLQARKMSIPDNSPSFIGIVKEVNLAGLQEALDRHYIPIIPPFGIGPQGRSFILDPNQIALEVAARLRAHKLIIMTSENGGLKQKLGGKRQHTTNDMKKWLTKEKHLNLFTVNQLNALVDACERGVERCHSLDSSIDGILLGEILTSAGIGIMITNSSFESIRPARIGDVHSIAEILEKPMEDMAVVQKSFHYLEQHIENFLVFCIDEDAVGCCELLPFDENQSVEIGSLAVKETHRNRGIGKKLIAASVAQAKQQKRKLIFALTTRVKHLFTALGFGKLSPDQLPDRKREKYDFSASEIYGKFLN